MTIKKSLILKIRQAPNGEIEKRAAKKPVLFRFFSAWVGKYSFLKLC
jgi:hypothetical protein